MDPSMNIACSFRRGISLEIKRVAGKYSAPLRERERERDHCYVEIVMFTVMSLAYTVCTRVRYIYVGKRQHLPIFAAQLVVFDNVNSSGTQIAKLSLSRFVSRIRKNRSDARWQKWNETPDPANTFPEYFINFSLIDSAPRYVYNMKTHTERVRRSKSSTGRLQKTARGCINESDVCGGIDPRFAKCSLMRRSHQDNVLLSDAL